MSKLKTLQFDQFINAPVSTVWEAIVTKEKFEKWTSAFTEGSTFEGSWEEGSEIRFLNPDNDGMIANIKEVREPEFISIAHFGFIEKGEVNDLTDEWGGVAYENYTFTEKDGGTHIHVDQDILPEYEEMFLKLWPKALLKLKEVCEK